MREPSRAVEQPVARAVEMAGFCFECATDGTPETIETIRETSVWRVCRTRIFKQVGSIAGDIRIPSEAI